MEIAERKSGADYFSQFEKSPFRFRANERVQVQGKSNLKGSWQPPKEESKKQ